MFALVLALSLIASEPSAALKSAPAKKEAAQATQGPASAAPLSNVSVTLDCATLASGRVGDCVVVEESRPGLGFGDAAVALMTGAPVDAALRQEARDGRFQHVIRFTP